MKNTKKSKMHKAIFYKTLTIWFTDFCLMQFTFFIITADQYAEQVSIGRLRFLRGFLATPYVKEALRP